MSVRSMAGSIGWGLQLTRAMRASLLCWCLLESPCFAGLLDGDRVLWLIEKREYQHHPHSAWYYMGTSGDDHVLESEVWKMFGDGSKTYRISKDLLKIEEPFEYERKATRGKKVSIAILEDQIRFSIKDQEPPQFVDYDPHYDWTIYRERPVYDAHENRDRPSKTLWEGITLFADKIQEESAKGHVLVEFPRQPTKDRPNPSPHLFYGDKITFDLSKERATIRGDVAERLEDDSYFFTYAMSRDTEVELMGDRWKFDGATKSRNAAKPGAGGTPRLTADMPEMTELPDLAAYQATDRASLDLWNGMKVYADTIDKHGRLAEGQVYIDASGGKGEETTFKVYGERLDFDREQQTFQVRGVVAVEALGGTYLGLSLLSEFQFTGEGYKLDGPFRFQMSFPSP